MTVVRGIGIWTGVLDGLPLGQARELVAELDEQGWQSLWFGEAYGREALTAAMTWLSSSSRMAVGTGIANLYARDAVATAAAARTIHAAHPGRFVLGLGVSHLPLVERMRGHRYQPPLQAMGEYLSALDAAPALVPEEAALPPRVLAALGPRMLELSRDRTQGAHPYLVTPEHTATARQILGGSAEDGPMLIVEQAAVVDPAAAERDEDWGARAHAHLEIYTGLPNYRASWERLGFDRSDFIRGGSPRLAAALVPRGEDALRQRVNEHFEAGASAVVIQVLGASPAAAPQRDWARLAEALL